jgi:hypothetical protein
MFTSARDRGAGEGGACEGGAGDGAADDGVAGAGRAGAFFSISPFDSLDVSAETLDGGEDSTAGARAREDAGAEALVGGARVARKCGVTKSPPRAAAARLPKIAGRHHGFAARRGGEPIRVSPFLAARSAASRCAFWSTARRTRSLGRLESRSDARL